MRKRLFLVQFNNVEDKDGVIKRGVYFFDKKSFLVKPWNEAMTVDTSAISTLPICIQFPKLDIKY